MQRWVYRTHRWYWKQGDGDDPMRDALPYFQEFGQYGWELVNVVSHPNIWHDSTSSWTDGAWFVATFKMPVVG